MDAAADYLSSHELIYRNLVPAQIVVGHPIVTQIAINKMPTIEIVAHVAKSAYAD